MRKMRLLTFMQMCEGKSELDYNFVQDELKFDSQDELEIFIIEGEKTQQVYEAIRAVLPCFSSLKFNRMFRIANAKTNMVQVVLKLSMEIESIFLDLVIEALSFELLLDAGLLT